MTASSGRLILWKSPTIGVVLDPGDGRRLYKLSVDQVLDEVEAWLGRNWPREVPQGGARVRPEPPRKKPHV